MNDDEVMLKTFCDSIQSAIGSDSELEEIFIKSFESIGGEEKCQLKK